MSPTPRLLQHGRLLPELETALAAEFDVHRLAEEADPAAFLAAQGQHFTGLVTSAGVGADAALIAALPRLQVIASFGVGVDLVDLDAAAARGIQVSCTPDVLNDCVADLAMGLMLRDELESRGIHAVMTRETGTWRTSVRPSSVCTWTSWNTELRNSSFPAACAPNAHSNAAAPSAHRAFRNIPTESRAFMRFRALTDFGDDGPHPAVSSPCPPAAPFAGPYSRGFPPLKT